MGFPVEIGGRADESVPFVKKASLKAPFQWKLGRSKIFPRLSSQCFRRRRGSVLASFGERGVLRRYFIEVEDTHPPISTGN